jgi:vacuolar-type H+-ATPase subunit E/Vma4
MGLEQLCREISATAEARAAALMSEATQQADRIVAAARGEGHKTVAAAQTEGEAFGAAEYSERVNAAKMEEQKLYSEAREEAVRRGLEAVWARYASQSKRPGYAKNLRTWAERAVQELDAPAYVLRARGEDLKLLSEAGFKVSKEALECSGGVKAETAGGRIGVDCTLETLFDGKKEEAYKEVHARLFSDEKSHAIGGGKVKPTRLMTALLPKNKKSVRKGAGARKAMGAKKGANAKMNTAKSSKKSKRGRR